MKISSWLTLLFFWDILIRFASSFLELAEGWTSSEGCREHFVSHSESLLVQNPEPCAHIMLLRTDSTLLLYLIRTNLTVANIQSHHFFRLEITGLWLIQSCWAEKKGNCNCKSLFDPDILRAFILQHDRHQRGEGRGDSDQEWRHHGGQEAFGVSEGVAPAPYSATRSRRAMYFRDLRGGSTGSLLCIATWRTRLSTTWWPTRRKDSDSPWTNKNWV